MSLKNPVRRSLLKTAVGIVPALLMIGAGGLIGASFSVLIFAAAFFWSEAGLPLPHVFASPLGEFLLGLSWICGLFAGLILGFFWARAMLKD